MVSTRSKLKEPDSNFILSHIRFPTKTVDYRAIYDKSDPEKAAFVKLLEAINIRASEVSNHQPNFPKMDLSALYCLGITIQEYARHLSTDILTQKKAVENKPSIDTAYTSEEIKSRTLESIIQKFKPQKSTIIHAKDDLQVTARPNIEQELSFSSRERRANINHQVEIQTSNKGNPYDQLFLDPEWKGSVAKKRRDLNANSEEAAARRANAELLKQQRLEIRRAKEELEAKEAKEAKAAIITRKRVRNEDDTNYDVFDKTSNKPKKKAKASPAKKKNKTASSQKGF